MLILALKHLLTNKTQPLLLWSMGLNFLWVAFSQDYKKSLSLTWWYQNRKFGNLSYVSDIDDLEGVYFNQLVFLINLQKLKCLIRTKCHNLRACVCLFSMKQGDPYWQQEVMALTEADLPLGAACNCFLVPLSLSSRVMHPVKLVILFGPTCSPFLMFCSPLLLCFLLYPLPCLLNKAWKTASSDTIIAWCTFSRLLRCPRLIKVMPSCLQVL